MKYFAIILLLTLFVIFYVWQNIEVMKLKMNYSKQVAIENKLIKQKDRIVYELEKFKTMHYIQEYAEKHNLRKIKPKDFTVLQVEK